MYQTHLNEPQGKIKNWIFAGLSALLLFLSFPNLNLFPFAWVAMVPFFIALTRATSWKSAFWIGYLTGFLFFAGLLPAILLLYPYANIFATMVGYLLLVGYTALYFAVFAVLTRFVPRRSQCPVFAVRGMYLDSIRMGAKLADNRVSMGKYRLFAMEQSTRNTDSLACWCTRYQFRHRVLQCRHRYLAV